MRAFLLITFCLFIQACSKEFVDAGFNCGLDENRLGEFVIVPAGKLVDVGIGVSPSRGVQTFRDIPSFLMQVNEVTNLEFDRFVSETGYLTDAERSASSGRLDSGSAVFVSPMARRILFPVMMQTINTEPGNQMFMYSRMGTIN